MPSSLAQKIPLSLKEPCRPEQGFIFPFPLSSCYCFVLQQLPLLPCYRLLLLWINIVFLLIFMYVLGT